MTSETSSVISSSDVQTSLDKLFKPGSRGRAIAELLLKGESDSKKIAELTKTKPPYVRNMVYQLRKAGILPPPKTSSETSLDDVSKQVIVTDDVTKTSPPSVGKDRQVIKEVISSVTFPVTLSQNDRKVISPETVTPQIQPGPRGPSGLIPTALGTSGNNPIYLKAFQMLETGSSPSDIIQHVI